MKLKNILSPKIRKAIRRVINAEIDNDRKGGGDPADFPAIEKELKAARKNLKLVLASVDDILERDCRGRFPHLFAGG